MPGFFTDAGQADSGVPLQASPYNPAAAGRFGGPQSNLGGGNGTAPPASPPAPAPAWQPAEMPDFMTPAMQSYVNQFKASQASQQQAINAGLMQAMQGLGQRRDAAAQLVASVPGTYQGISNAANADSAAANKLVADQPNGVTGPATQAIQQLNTNANNSIATAGKQITPLLNMGVAADYSKGQTTLSNQQMQNNAALAQQQSQFDQHMLDQRAQAQSEWDKMQASFHHDDTTAKNAADNQKNFLLWERDNNLVPKSNDPLSAAQDQYAVTHGFRDYATLQNAQDGEYTKAVIKAFSTGQKVPLPGAGNVTIHGSDRAKLTKQVAGDNQDVYHYLVMTGVITAKDQKDAGLAG